MTEWHALATPEVARSVRGRETQQRMILAAADLFAERGIDAVSPNEILQAAGQRNASAIQYHFGSREGLVIAVLQPRPDLREPMERVRTAILDEVLSGRAPLTLEGAVRAYVMPFVGLLGSRAGRSFVRVAAQVMRTLPLEHRVAPSMPSELRAHQMIMRAMPPLPDEVRDSRIGVMATLTSETLANRAREIEHGITPNLDEEAFGRELVAMIMGILAAPSPVAAGG